MPSQNLSSDRALWLAWSHLPGIGAMLLSRLKKHFGSLAVAWEATAAELMAVEGVGPTVAESVVSERRQIDPEQFLQQHEQQNSHFWTPADAAYPQLLSEIPDFPGVLYYRGQVNLAESTGQSTLVGIVGTRSPSEYGRRWTRRLVKALVAQEVTVVSGLAAGIDTEAHRSCLEAGGRTIAVLGTGVDLIYPWSNRSLYQELVKQGLAVSEYPAGTPPDRVHFPRRNRIIAGLCQAILVIEAPAKSGALITAHLANDYGRDVYALPGSLDHPNSMGCLNLINQGAQIILSEDALLESLGQLPSLARSNQEQSPPPPLNLSLEEGAILYALETLSQELSLEALPFDSIVQRSQLPASIVSSTLLQLELMGLVVQHPGMRYQRS